MKARAQVFLSYAREDKEKVEKLYRKLSNVVGVNPWMDKEDILPGETWENRIRAAIKRSDLVLVCLSENSVNKRGWIQREIKDALNMWQEKLGDDIYLIPVRLEDCEVPTSLRKFQWVDLFEPGGWSRLIKAIQVGRERQGNVSRPIAQESTQFEPYPVYEEPLHIPFANRENEIESILSPLAPPYYLLDAPAGYGKTYLLKELKRRLEEQGWVCAYAPAGEHDSLPALAVSLAQEMDVQLKLDPDARRLGANLASALNRQRREDITRQGLALLIDLSKRPSFPIRDLLDQFISAIQDSLRFLDFFATKHNRFRVVIAGCFSASQEVVSTTLPLKVLKLTPFDYDVVRDTARDYLAGYSESSIVQISAHVMHLTGGHPGCMARILEMYRESGFSPDDFLTFYVKDIQDIVLREVEYIRNDIRPRLRSTLDGLSVFRYLDYGMLWRLISSDILLIQGYASEYDLANELTRTHLLDWEGRLLRDDTTRHLLAIRLWQEMMEEFSTRCQQAQTIYADHLREPTTQSPEMWGIEYLFQFLQQHADIIQDSAERSKIRQTFFEDEVPKALKLLADGRNARVEQEALKQALDKDWEFRFTVNYYLRQDQYSDEPHEKLQREIDSFFSSIVA